MSGDNIHQSVGSKPARNQGSDQATIMRLLNAVGDGDGGAAGKLKLNLSDNTPNQDLVAAITKFQTFHKERLKFKPDGRVDPYGATWRLLTQFANARSGGLAVPEWERAFPGIDIAWFNDVFIKWLHDYTNLMWIAYYLPEAKYSSTKEHPDQAVKASWKGKFTRLKEMGWFGVAPIYFGMQRRDANRRTSKDRMETGKHDGAQAATMAAAEKIPQNSTIYCDMEGGDFGNPKNNLTDVWTEYIHGWVEGLRGGGYFPGVYASHLFVDKVISYVESKTGVAPEGWVVNISKQSTRAIPNPKSFPAPPLRESGSARAKTWQFTNAFNIDWAAGRVGIDMDSSVYSDPGRRISPFDRK